MQKRPESGQERPHGGDAARRRAACRIGGLLGAVLPPAARRRGFAEAGILAEWATIVGPELAARCAPLALRFPPGARGGAVLELAIASAGALELQHAAPQLIERINGHLGFRAVARLQLRHRAPPRPTEPAPPPPLDPALDAELERGTSGLAEGDLRAALRDLGRTLLGRAGRGR